MRGFMRFAASVSVAAATFMVAGQATSVGVAGAAVDKAAGVAGAAVDKATAPQTSGHLVYRGTVNLGAIAARKGASATAPGARPARPVSPLQPKSAAQAAAPAPNPPATPILPRTGGAKGFVGLTTADSGAVNGFDVEPPDQGLCAHNGVVLEAVNLAVRAYTVQGVALSGTVSLNQFFGLAPAVSTHNPPTYGPFLSDPRCYYDPQTARWFLTSLEIDVNPYTGALAYRSSELIAVSQTSDPTGNYGLFSFDTTNDGTGGTPSEPNCPCLGDQPRIGADAHGFYISTDSYPIHGVFNSNGGELYAMSKQGLAAAASTGGTVPSLVAIHVGAVPIDGYPANAVQPAETPEGGSYAPNREYFLSTPDFNGFATSGGAGAQAVVLWSLSGTSSLASASPSLTLTNAIIPSERYVPPVPALQKPGPRPLGQSLNAPLPPISVNDDRMQQVEYLNGHLFSSLNTGVGPKGAANRSGVAWFEVTPRGSTGTVSHQGYIAAGGTTTLLYPSIGLNQSGRGVLTFSVSGPTYYPSAAYMLFSGTGPTGSIYLSGPGAAPEDGFTCYAQEGFGPTCRWGDYTAASGDGTGRVVMGDEMIPNTARDPLANWGTFLSSLNR
jgi:hypothetical protein